MPATASSRKLPSTAAGRKMPSRTRTRLSFRGLSDAATQTLLSEILTDDGPYYKNTFSFHSLIPRPTTLGVGAHTAQWMMENWGAQSNAQSFCVSSGERAMSFTTSWAHPHLVISALSSRYPSVLFHAMYSEADMHGAYFGDYFAEGGVVVATRRFLTKEEAMIFRLKIHESSSC